MRVNIDFYYDKEEDGIEGSSSASRDGVFDLYTMSQFLADAMRGAGYSYVTDVGFERDDGTVTFGEMQVSKGKVLIDGDIIAYRAAFATQDLTERDAEEKVDDLIEYILDQTIDLPFPSPEDYETYLTGKTNFRHDIAKSHPYKGNRSASEKPEHLGAAREHMVNNWDAIVSVNEEADDLISKGAAETGYNCVVASVDKDMLQLPCWHFNFVKGEWTKVDEWSGIKFFYTQILTGDAADNIKGLHRVGPKTSEKMLAHCETEEDLWETCVKAYDGDTERVIENARLLWLRRYEDQLWEPPQGA